MDSKKIEPTTRAQFDEKQQIQNFFQNETQELEISNDKTQEQIINSQEYQKTTQQNCSGHYVKKIKHKAFNLLKSQQDLVVFCLSLLQFEAQFPLRFTLIQSQKENKQSETQNIKEKEVWLETQLLTSSDTHYQNFSVMQLKFQKKINQFFSKKLIPCLKDFKQKKMCWSYMVTEQYIDQKVIQDFNEQVVKKLNKDFKKYCREI